MIRLIVATAAVMPVAVAFLPPPTSCDPRRSCAASASKSNDGGVAGDADMALLERSSRLLAAFAQKDQTRGKKRPRKQKRFRFGATVSASTTVAQAEDAALTLDAYMGLPMDEYELLDERFVSRTEDGFRFSLPFGEVKDRTGKKPLSVLSGVTAQCDLGVQSDAEKQKNTITASSFRIVVDQENVDEVAAQFDSDKEILAEKVAKMEKMAKQKLAKQSNITSSNSTASENAFETLPSASGLNTTERGANNSSTLARLQEEDIAGSMFTKDFFSKIQLLGVLQEEEDTLSKKLSACTTEERASIERDLAELHAAIQDLEQDLENMKKEPTAEERAEMEQVANIAVRSLFRALDAGALAAEGAVVLSWGTPRGRLPHLFGGAAASPTAGGGTVRTLDAKLTLDAEVTLTVPFPRFLLNPVGSVVLRIAFGQLLPRLLQIVGRDYERRAAGKTLVVLDDDDVG